MTTTFNQKKVYYEVHGTGDPIIFLNGIMMSTQSWQALLPAYHSYQVILIDLYDQGQTDTHEGYTISSQGNLVCHVIDTLGLENIHIMGISYGGEVAMDVALKRSHQVLTLSLFNTTCYTDEALFQMGKHWLTLTSNHQGDAFYDATIPHIYGETFKQNMQHWMQQRETQLRLVFNTPTFLNKMHRLTQSSQLTDYRSQLNTLKMPVLIVSGSEDTLIPVHYQKTILKYISHASHVIVENAGHALMYENTQIFNSLVIGFIESSKHPIDL